MLHIRPGLDVDEAELVFTFTTGGGPGGQNVNKVATRAALQFDIARSGSLSDHQRRRLLAELANRVSAEGVLRIVAGTHRTQAANRRAAILRFVELLAEALRPRPVRKKSRPSRAAVQRRLDTKARQSERKRQRRSRPHFDRDQ